MSEGRHRAEPAAAVPPAPAPAPAPAAAAGGPSDELRLARAAMARQFERQQGAASSSAAGGEAAVPIGVCSYNIWFNFVEQPRLDAVARLLCEGAAAEPPGAPPPPANAAAMPSPAFVGLQEVTPQWAAHLRPKLVAGGFHGLHCQQPPQQYFVALATRPPLSALRDVTTLDYHRTMMGRALVFGRATWPGVGELVLGTTHLESFVGPDQQAVVKPNRRAQLQQAATALEAAARRHGCVGAVLVGDFNWKETPSEDGGPAVAVVNAAGCGGWVDAWNAAGAPQNAKKTCYWNRFDHCLVWTPPPGGAAAAAPAARTLSGAARRRRGGRGRRRSACSATRRRCRSSAR